MQRVFDRRRVDRQCAAVPQEVLERYEKWKDIAAISARRLERDVKAVHADITALLAGGILDRVEDGRVVYPYDAV
ncbi:MAG: hypothetical protein J0L91_11120 [Burkholderiales bacterium]|nr:hypothetical protein [Burkholderiales bacterium]